MNNPQTTLFANESKITTNVLGFWFEKDIIKDAGIPNTSSNTKKKLCQNDGGVNPNACDKLTGGKTAMSIPQAIQNRTRLTPLTMQNVLANFFIQIIVFILSHSASRQQTPLRDS